MAVLWNSPVCSKLQVGRQAHQQPSIFLPGSTGQRINGCDGSLMIVLMFLITRLGKRTAAFRIYWCSSLLPSFCLFVWDSPSFYLSSLTQSKGWNRPAPQMWDLPAGVLRRRGELWGVEQNLEMFSADLFTSWWSSPLRVLNGWSPVASFVLPWWSTSAESMSWWRTEFNPSETEMKNNPKTRSQLKDLMFMSQMKFTIQREGSCSLHFLVCFGEHLTALLMCKIMMMHCKCVHFLYGT